jgi:drug/metabolite transporter (DMT)-like permease
VGPARIAALTIAALLGFAANSLLCRAAIGAHEIDPATFTAVRLASGALVLAVLVQIRSTGAARGSWLSALALFAYAAAFSFAYVRLTTATGALLLFAFVQISMISVGVVRGERPRAFEWIGHATAVAGLIALVLPGLTSPDPIGAVLVASAGIAWGMYSLRGRGAKDPLAITADNFLRTVPLAAVLVGIAFAVRGDLAASGRGIGLAMASGAIASGVGYSIWYAALPHLPATRAAVVQLSVPAIAAAGGMAVLGEVMTARFALCAAAILGGVAIAILGRKRA